MKSYEESKTFVRKIAKRVYDMLRMTTRMWTNTPTVKLQDAEHTSTSQNDDGPPVKKLCLSNISDLTRVSSNASVSSTENSRNVHVDVHLHKISDDTCAQITSKQNL